MLAEALAAGSLPMLQELILHDNRLGDAGAVRLADALGAGAGAHLQDLSMDDNGIGQEGARAPGCCRPAEAES